MLLRQDLTQLSQLAGNGGAGVEPLVLRVQTDLFASVQAHDRASRKAFETLALALIPKVDEDTLAHVAGILRSLPDAPSTILAAIAARIGQSVEPAASAPPRAAGARELQDLVDRAGREPDLARALLAEGSLPPLEAARLYLHADREQRAGIRAALAGAGMAGRRPMRLRRSPPEAVDGLLAAAGGGNAAVFGARLALCLGLVKPPVWDFHKAGRRDLLALAVAAIGVCEEDAVRIFLTLDRDIACSVEAVFDLVRIFRTTPRSVSMMILEAALDLTIAPRTGLHLPGAAGLDLADRPGAAARPWRMSGRTPEPRENTGQPLSRKSR